MKGLTKATMDFIGFVNKWLNAIPWYIMAAAGAGGIAALIFFGYVVL